MSPPPWRSGWRHELRNLWSILHSRRGEGEVASYAIGVNTAAGPVRAAVDRAGGHHLLVPVAPGETVHEDLRSAHVRLERCVLEIRGRRTAFLDVGCSREDLYHVFDDALAAMLELIERTPDDAVAACIRAWEDWRRLLQGSAEALGDNALRGLFAEIVVLERILAARPTSSVSHLWTGPDRAPHDFSLGEDSLEVKALGPRGSSVTIHGLDQLEEPQEGRLFLVLVRLESDENEGCTLPELVERVRAVATDRAGFVAQTTKAGYFEHHADAYRDRRFGVTQTRVLRVSSTFPRIVTSSIAAGVPRELRGITYTLDLSSRLPEAISDIEFDEVLRREG